MSTTFKACERRFRMQTVAEKGNSLVGYAAKFETLSSDLGGFRERIARGAFTNAVNQDVRALINHDPNKLLGRTKSGTLRLTQDSTGLRFNIVLPDTSYAKDLLTSVKRGDVSQCSFGFISRDDSFDYETDETGKACLVRTVRDCDLMDVSVVTYPAYEDTEVSARNLLPSNLFPEGLPAELRSKLSPGSILRHAVSVAVSSVVTLASPRRRQLLNTILS